MVIDQKAENKSEYMFNKLLWKFLIMLELYLNILLKYGLIEMPES